MDAAPADADLLGDVRARMRPGLVVSPQARGAGVAYVLKDPVGLKYARLRAEEYFLLTCLDGRRALDEVQRLFAARFAPRRIALADLDRFVRQCLLNGLAVVATPKAGLRLYERGRAQRWAKLRQSLLNVMGLKVPLVDPDRLLARLLPLAGWAFTRPALHLAALFWGATLLFALVHWGRVEARLPAFRDFFGADQLLGLWLAVGAVKVAHELGHALACKRFGGEVHELGFMLLVFSPALYCNVSDAWTFPRLSRRLAVGAAGIYVEATLAAACFWAWWGTAPGALNSLALGVVAVCGVGTLLFNANPLLKFDGYYLLSDLVGVPNLRQRANRRFGNLAARWAFGKEVLPDPLAPTRGRWAFALFAAASYAYRWVVAVGIVLFLYTLLKPYRLEVLSRLLAWAAVLSMAVVPAVRAARLVGRRWPAMRVRRGRAVIGVAAAAILLAAVLTVPLPRRVAAPCVVRFEAPAEVVAPSAGVLRAVHVRDGDRVEPGQVLAELDSPLLARRVRGLELEAEREEARLRAAEAFDDPPAAAAARRALEARREELRLLRAERAGLVVRCPPHASGVAVAPLKEEDVGRPLRAGAVLCRVGDPARAEVYAVVEAADVALVAAGARAWVRLRGASGPPFPSRVERVAHTKLADLPAGLSNRVKGGEVAAAPRAGRGEGEAEGPQGVQPALTSYALTLSAAEAPGPLVPGVRGVARVDAGWSSLGERLARWVRQTLSFRL